MIPGLQTHFNALVGAEALTAVRELGFRMVRIDAQRSDEDLTRSMIAETTAADLRPYVIIREAEQLRWLPSGAWAEPRNEPNLEGPNPVDYAALLAEAAAVAGELGHQLWAPAISNLDKDGFEYLRGIGPLPAGVNGSFHWYAHGGNPDTPHPGFNSRAHEVETWRSVVGDRSWGVSETGFSTARRARYTDWRKNLPIYDRWTDEEVAAHVRHELAFWTEMGAEFMVLFQLNDGPDDTKEHRFGIRRMDGTWKPVAHVLES